MTGTRIFPKGGFQQDEIREYALPRTTDETRVVSKPKLSYEPPVIPGQSVVTQPGVQADVNKNKPDRFAVLGMDRVNTAVGAQTATRVYPEQPMKTQARETTEKQYYGSAGGSNGVAESYIRAFTEPFMEFMKLTAEGRPGPAGVQGTGFSIGSDMCSAQTKKDETVLSDAARINGGLVRYQRHGRAAWFVHIRCSPTAGCICPAQRVTHSLTHLTRTRIQQKLNSF